jgi:hypothetical protein
MFSGQLVFFQSYSDSVFEKLDCTCCLIPSWRSWEFIGVCNVVALEII